MDDGIVAKDAVRPATIQISSVSEIRAATQTIATTVLVEEAIT